MLPGSETAKESRKIATRGVPGAYARPTSRAKLHKTFGELYASAVKHVEAIAANRLVQAHSARWTINYFLPNNLFRFLVAARR